MKACILHAVWGIKTESNAHAHAHTRSRVVMWFFEGPTEGGGALCGVFLHQRSQPLILASSLTQDDPSVRPYKYNYILINKHRGR